MKEVPPKNKCLYCGAETPALSKFCIHCGKNIEKYNEYRNKRGLLVIHICIILLSMVFKVLLLFEDYIKGTHNIEDSTYIATLILDIACLPFIIILIRLMASYKFWGDTTKKFHFKSINIFYLCFDTLMYFLQILVIW